MATDRRIKYTKMVLKDCLIQLLHVKPISRITIKELCAAADINRATYYSHYTDQFDQLKQIELEFISEINVLLDGFSADAGESDILQMTEKIFVYIRTNHDLCRALLGENGDIDFQTNIMNVLAKRIIDEWLKNKGLKQSVSEYTHIFIISGCMGIVKKWLFEDNEPTPAEMAKLVIHLTNSGMRSL